MVQEVRLAKVVRMVHWTVKEDWDTEYFHTVDEALIAARALSLTSKAYVVEIVSKEEAPQGIKIIHAHDRSVLMNDMTRSELTEVYNELAPAPVKGFRDHPTAVRRTEGALEAAFPNEESVNMEGTEESGVSTIEITSADEGTKRRGRAAKGVDPKEDVKRLRPGTTRAKILTFMNGENTPSDIAAYIDGVDAAKVLAHAYCLARDVGVGYGFDEEGRIFARYPEGKGILDVLPPEE